MTKSTWRNLVITILVLHTGYSHAQKSGKTYSEDLTPLRLHFKDTVISGRANDSTSQVHAVPTHQINVKVDAILDSIDRLNRTKRFIDGFTMQVYSGQRRDDAMNAKQKIITESPDLTANLQYIQPTFRVTIGHYLTKLEAEKDLVRVRRFFPSAILVPDKISIK
jgi:hypothetical protein